MKYLLALMLVLAPFSIVISQGIQEKVINNFCGGMVNSLTNSLIPDNAAVVLKDYRIDDCALVRRGGIKQHFIIDPTISTVGSLFAFYNGLSKTMFVTGGPTAFDAWGDVRDTLYYMRSCVDANEVCDAIEFYPMPAAQRDSPYPYSASHAMLTGNLAIASSGAELLAYDQDGDKRLYPVRPRGPYQPAATAINGGGNLTGTYTYKYCYADVGTDTSNLSLPSWPVTVEHGQVVITELLPQGDLVDYSVDSIFVWREDGDGVYKRVGNVADTANLLANYSLVDNTATLSAGDTLPFPWGWVDQGRPRTIPPPGAPQITVDTTNTVTVPGYSFVSDAIGESGSATDTITTGWAVVYRDKNGLWSPMGPPHWVYVTSGTTEKLDSTWGANATYIPLDTNEAITDKYLVKMHSLPTSNNTMVVNADPDSIGVWILYDTVALSSANKILGFKHFNVNWDYRLTNELLFCGVDTVRERLWLPDTTATDTGYYYIGGDSTHLDVVPTGEEPEDLCYKSEDSAISFTPSAVVSHGHRLYAVGDLANPHRLYYSNFGQVWNWPTDHFLQVGTQKGDWLVGLSSNGTSRLDLFLQNSVWSLSGHTFYQYTLDEVFPDVGLTGPRTLSRGLIGTFFAHRTGVYTLGNPTPVSAPIQKSVDSVASTIKSSFGVVVNNEYWWSVGKSTNVPEVTYIYSTRPIPHWRSYSLGIMDMIKWDWDSLFMANTQDRWIIALDDDSLYRWGECDTCLYDNRAGAADSIFEALYVSKSFFDNGQHNREKIFYIDIEGTGPLDSILVTVKDNFGGSTVFTQKVYVDFSDNKRDRVMVNQVVVDCQVSLQDYGQSIYRLTGYTIGWAPWDDGRMK